MPSTAATNSMNSPTARSRVAAESSASSRTHSSSSRIAAQLQNLGIDEALHQPEDVGVGAALDLPDEPFLTRRQGGELASEREPVRQEFLGVVEAASTDDVLLDVPTHPLGGLNAPRI